MAQIRTRAAALAAGLSFVLAACSDGGAPQAVQGSEQPTQKLGLMTSLPLYWPLGAEFGAIASGQAEAPWQREVLERDHELVLLDTLTPIPGLTAEAAETDPLEGLERIAIIQPRGLSPADNVALDNWVREGGQLLLLLDPQLTGEYEVPLGDPRRPNDTAIIPPVLPRWGLAGAFNVEQTELLYEEVAGGRIPVLLGSELRVVVNEGEMNGCRTSNNLLIIQCDSVGAGTVTYLGDAALFEHEELAGEDGEAIHALLSFAYR